LPGDFLAEYAANPLPLLGFRVVPAVSPGTPICSNRDLPRVDIGAIQFREHYRLAVKRLPVQTLSCMRGAATELKPHFSKRRRHEDS
jgi:hypothetical protein